MTSSKVARPSKPKTASAKKRRSKFAWVEKPAAQHEAETRFIEDEICEIPAEISLAAFAVIGLADSLNDSDAGLGLSNWLHDISAKVSDVEDRLSPIDEEATKQKLDKVLGR